MAAKKGFTRRITKNKEVSAPRETRIAFVIDRSGSMGTIRAEAISTINTQMDAVKRNVKLTGDTYVTYINFNGTTQKVFENRPAETLYPITEEQYIPSGGTALRDALGDAIMALQSRPVVHEDTAYLVIVVSDGEENSSTRYTPAQMAGLTKNLTMTGKWTFSYLLSNLSDAQMREFASQYSAPVGNMQTFVADSAGMMRGATFTANAISTYGAARSMGQTSTAGFYGDNANATYNTTTTTPLTVTTPFTVNVVPPASKPRAKKTP